MADNVKDTTQLALDFFAGMGPNFDSLTKTFDSAMADDVVWESVGFDHHDGKQDCLAYLDTLQQTTGLEYCEIGVHNIAAVGDVVLTERVDKMFRTDGSLIMDFRVAGVLEFRDGKIVRYTDYLDTHGTVQRLSALAAEMGH